MTVEELIKELQGMPMDAEVYYNTDEGYDTTDNIYVDNDGDVVIA